MQIMFIIILWIVISFLLICKNIEIFYDLTMEKKILVCLVFLVFGPAIAVTDLAETLLDFLLPGGWDNNDSWKP